MAFAPGMRCQKPEILRTPLEEVALHIKLLHVSGMYVTKPGAAPTRGPAATVNSRVSNPAGVAGATGRGKPDAVLPAGVRSVGVGVGGGTGAGAGAGAGHGTSNSDENDDDNLDDDGDDDDDDDGEEDGYLDEDAFDDDIDDEELDALMEMDFLDDNASKLDVASAKRELRKGKVR